MSLKSYIEKYYMRLSDGSQSIILQMIIFTNSILRFLTEQKSENFPSIGKAVEISEVISAVSSSWPDSREEIHKFMKGMKDSVAYQENIVKDINHNAVFLPNISHWINFLEKYDTIRKINGFYKSQKEKKAKILGQKYQTSIDRSLLYTFKDFLSKFNQLDQDSKFILKMTGFQVIFLLILL